MKIEIIGLGYVGYPLALQAASKGHEVFGVDKNTSLIEQIKLGKSPVTSDAHIESLQEKVKLEVGVNVESSDVFIVCVPTPVTRKSLPDLSFVIKAVEDISRVLEDDNLIVIESTIYPGVCDDIVAPILNRTGKRYLLAHCPERINPGDKYWNVSNIPRVVGGNTEIATKEATNLYKEIIDADITPLSQLKAAEATKILENTFRDINIAFINEMAQSFYRLGINVKEVIKGASTKPFAFMPHFPGLGVGGHCIAVDPYYMIEKGKEVGFDHDFLALARKINTKMPSFSVDVIQDGLNDLSMCLKGTNITVLGLSYKPNVRDDRESPSYEVIELLKKKGAVVNVYDPFFLEKSDTLTFKEALFLADCVLLATAHDEFVRNINEFKGIKLLVDGRNALNSLDVEQLGILYKGIGIA
ncbi:nucleotide sugar dehydrogenase [Spirochaeta cellobiosiphila]|uniref:nucleotide sugar dehydrogenase n=1 Tax=Spirochaeta cellobiosiphila TaxID=504483 RepID=UPI00040376D4|nr:nucleotide sugar dehydrogenase [Spirochaeta cellobiosiphila]